MSSGGMIAGRGANLAFGFVFWVLAARLFPASEVGLAAGAVSATMLCVQFALLGVGSAFIGQLPAHRSHPQRLLDTALTIVGIGGLAGGTLFLLLARGAFVELREVVAVPSFAALFLTMVALGAAGVLLDQISMALRRGEQLLSRNAASGVATVALVAALPLLPARTGGLEIFAIWVVGGLITCGWGFVQLRRSVTGYCWRPRIDGTAARGLLRVGFPNHLLNLGDRTSGLVLPVVVTELVSPEANAHWYAVWMMAWVVFMIPFSVGIATFAEVADRPDSLRTSVRHGILAALVAGLAAATLLALAAPVVLSILGPDYVTAGTVPLRILLLGVVPMTLVQAYFAVCRATARLGEAIVTGAVNVVLGLGAAVLAGMQWGLAAMALAWVAVQYPTGAWASWRLHSISTEPRGAGGAGAGAGRVTSGAGILDSPRARGRSA